MIFVVPSPLLVRRQARMIRRVTGRRVMTKLLLLLLHYYYYYYHNY